MNKYRKSLFSSILMLLFAALAAAGCTTEAETPIPLPTAKVPSLLEIDGAINRWEGGNNRSYYVTVEETNSDGTFLYRIVIADGEIRAAQRSEKVEGKWQQPVAIDSAEAANYTVDAILARVLRDAKGEGEAPLNMFALFDSFSGYPTLIEAKAIPSYTEDGRMRLNREYSYTISLEVGVLLEQTFGLNKTPVLTLHRSGGETAACSTLRIFDDRSSVYSDDCRQVLLQLNPPEEDFTEILSLVAAIGNTEDSRTDDSGASNSVILHGTGSGTADSQMLDQVWALATELNEMLSKPIGAGVTMLVWNGESLIGFDMRTNLEQPAALEFRAPFYGGATDLPGTRLIFADAAGLKWLDTTSGDTGTYGANPTGQHYIPLSVTADGKILLQRYTEGSDAVEWGWISQENRSLQPLPIAAECIAGVQSNTTDSRVVIFRLDTEGCEDEAVLQLVDLDTDASTTLDAGGPVAAAAWSPDSNLIAAIVNRSDEGATSGSLVIIDPAGGERRELFAQAGELAGVAWRENGQRILFGLTGAGEALDGLLEIDLDSLEITNKLNGEGLAPIGFDPTGEFLAFREGNDLRVWLIDFSRVIPITNDFPTDTPFVGWINSATGE